jgi:D-lactate dehydrogenase
MPDAAYRRLHNDLKSFIPDSRMATDPLRTLAYGTDASFYRLIPRIVVRADTEAEVSTILRQTGRQNIAVTFRAAGTSLSGQAISDSVLLVAGESWQRWEVLDKGEKSASSRASSAPGPTGSWPRTAVRSAPTRHPSMPP